MTETLPDVTTSTDAELISRVRGGDTAAYGELFGRHRDAAARLARQLVRDPESDDLVSEAFVKVLHVLRTGGGPDVAFRAYLLTAVRRLHIDRVRSARRVQPSDELEEYDAGVPFQDTAVDGFERSATARAFKSLPERWQLVLWHVEVEGSRPADIAPLLGISPNSVSALAYRAREGLRQAYLQMHLADTAGEHCRWTTEHLGAYVRGGLSRRESHRVDGHLEECRRCTGVYLELAEVNSNLRGLLAPLLLGTLAPGYLASVSATGAGTTFGVGALLDRLTDVVKGMGANAAVGGAVVTTAVAGVVTAVVINNTGGPAEEIRADDAGAPNAIVASPTPSASPSAPTPPASTPPPPAEIADPAAPPPAEATTSPAEIADLVVPAAATPPDTFPAAGTSPADLADPAVPLSATSVTPPATPVDTASSPSSGEPTPTDIADPVDSGDQSPRTTNDPEQGGSAEPSSGPAGGKTDSPPLTLPDTKAPALTLPTIVPAQATDSDRVTVDFADRVSATDHVDGDLPVTCDPASGSTFEVGKHEVRCWATDAADNTAEGSFTVIVEDAMDPTLTLPTTITATATESDRATVDFADQVSATDHVDGDLPVTCDPASGSTFEVGKDEVRCWATDAADNTADGSFTVIVEKVTVPPDDDEGQIGKVQLDVEQTGANIDGEVTVELPADAEGCRVRLAISAGSQVRDFDGVGWEPPENEGSTELEVTSDELNTPLSTLTFMAKANPKESVVVVAQLIDGDCGPVGDPVEWRPGQ